MWGVALALVAAESLGFAFVPPRVRMIFLQRGGLFALLSWGAEEASLLLPLLPVFFTIRRAALFSF